MTITFSVCKSTLRLLGYMILPISIVAGAIILIVAEGLGFIEEF